MLIVTPSLGGSAGLVAGLGGRGLGGMEGTPDLGGSVAAGLAAAGLGGRDGAEEGVSRGGVLRGAGTG